MLVRVTVDGHTWELWDGDNLVRYPPGGRDSRSEMKLSVTQAIQYHSQ